LRKAFPPFVFLCTSVWLIAVALFGFFRLLFFFLYNDASVSVNPFFKRILFTSVSYDYMVASYIILIPVVLYSIQFLLNRNFKWVHMVAIIIMQLLLIFSVLILCVDIPFYSFFKSRLTTSVLMWVGDMEQSLKFMVSEKKFYPFISLFILMVALLVIVVKKSGRRIMKGNYSTDFPLPIRVLIVFVMLVFTFWGMRGFNKERAPGIREAFFTEHAFISQLTLNPVFTFFDSFELFKINYTDNDTAIKNVQQYLNITQPLLYSPIARKVEGTATETKKNVVVVLIESLSAQTMSIYEGTKNSTPFLDSIAQRSLFYKNFYSSGIHTCNGVYSTLFGLPALMSTHPMSNVLSNNLVFNGLPYTLKKSGYNNIFFCTHGPNFDNLGYFLSKNNIDRLFNENDYPTDARENAWGVNDEWLLDYSLGKMDSLSKLNKPFFASVLTISTHPPQEMPRKTNYKPTTTIPFDQAYEFTDYALKKFMAQASTYPWYNNTLFVFVADHGINLPSPTDAPLSFNHVPLLIFNPQDTSIKPAKESFGMQTDIFPTVMSAIGQPYINNTIGVNLLTEKRPYAFFSQDNRLCVINDEYYLVIYKSGNESLFKYKKNLTENVASQHTALVNDMKKYAYSFLQTTQWMIENKKTEVK